MDTYIGLDLQIAPIQRMNNAAIKQQIESKIQAFRSLPPTADNAIIRDQYQTIKELINHLSGATADEKQIFLEAANVVNLFSRQDEAHFSQATSPDASQRTAALARLQEWARRAGDLL